MAKIRMELVDVVCADPEDVTGPDEFSVVGAVYDGKETRGVLTSPITIGAGQTKPFSAGQSVLYDGQLSDSATLRIGLTACDEDAAKDWSKRGDHIQKIAGDVAAALKAVPHPVLQTAGMVVPVAVKA